MPNPKGSKKLFRSFIVLLLIAIAMLAGYWFLLKPKPILLGNQPLIIEIKPGTTAFQLVNQLQNSGLKINAGQFIQAMRFRQELEKIKAGEYLITSSTTQSQLITQIVAGKVFLRDLALIDGWTFKQILNAVNNNPYLEHQLSGLNTQQIMDKLGYPAVNPEGQFYPDTYRFSKGTPDVRVLKKAFQAMQNVMAKEWQNRASAIPYQTPYEALIAASLIQRETALLREQPLISGVIINRLRAKMRLQIDPTVIYALGDRYQGQLTAADLRVASPYNTYLYAGLPPTPIAIPTRMALHAALHPQATKALYYVAKGDGSHVFSENLKQQDLAIKEFLLPRRWLNELPKVNKWQSLIKASCQNYLMTILWHLNDK